MTGKISGETHKLRVLAFPSWWREKLRFLRVESVLFLREVAEGVVRPWWAWLAWWTENWAQEADPNEELDSKWWDR
jgi:hypothetical protein